MSNEEIVAMATAAIAEERGTDIQKVKVISFKEVSHNNKGTQDNTSSNTGIHQDFNR